MSADESKRGEILKRREIPYGLKIAEDAHHLEEDGLEVEAMVLMLEQIVEDQPMSVIAAALNERGFRQRDGAEWTQTAVFNMLPRLIEVGPDIYSSDEWAEIRRIRHGVLRAAG